jgi:hypothetical protein
MPNLTTEQRIVKPVLDANPIPDHDLVIFKKVGGGYRFHSVINPDLGGGPSFLSKVVFGANFVNYAVTRDRNLRYKLAVESLYSADHVGPFSLQLTLLLCVESSQLLVEKLESDPLLRLEQEVREVLGGVASRMSWSAIEAEAGEFENQLLAEHVMNDAGARVSSLVCLQEFALPVGLRLKGIQVSRTFSAEIGEEMRVSKEEERQRKIAEAQHKTALLKRQLQSQEAQFDAWQRNALSKIELIGALSESATANLQKVLVQISDKVDTAAALRSVLNELLAMRQEISRLPSLGESGEGNGDSGRLIVAGDLPRLAAAPRNPVESFLTRAFELARGLDCEPTEKGRLLSLVLHLLGELALHEEADEDAVLDYGAKLREQVRRLMRSTHTNQQREFLLQLQDVDIIRAELAGARQ